MAETPKEKLKKMTAWDTAPALTETELDELVSAARLADAAGFIPSDALWTPTYNLNAAAAEGWMIKAGRASDLIEADPGSGVFTSKVFDNCRMMAAIYANRTSASVMLEPPRAE